MTLSQSPAWARPREANLALSLYNVRRLDQRELQFLVNGVLGLDDPSTELDGDDEASCRSLS